MLGMPRFPRIQSLPAGSPGTRQGWLHPGCVVAEADRIAEFKEVAELTPDDPVVRFGLAGRI